MKLRLHIVLAVFCTALPAFSEPSEREIIAAMNRAQQEVAGGNLKGLDDLTKLPANISTPGFLTIFKQYPGGFHPSPRDRAIRLRCAQLAVSTPGGEEYLTKLLKGKPANNMVFYQQDSAIKCCVLVHDETAIRILGNALDDIEQEENAPKLVDALAELKLPGAPVSAKDKITTQSALVKWKQWWAENKSSYAGKAVVPPAP